VIVSHEHRCIFIKTRKTAGTSIEVMLAAHLEPGAIVTPIEPPAVGHEPRNFARPQRLVPNLHARYGMRGRADLDRERWFYNHIPAWLVRERLGRRRFDSYYKFAFERDPWDKCVSWYYYRTRRGDTDLGFADWTMHEKLPRDWGKYTIDDTLAVDFVGRFEHLEADLAHALRDIGLDVPIDLPREKATHRPTAAATTAAHTPETVGRIAEVFHREIAQFGYTPPEIGAPS
jgi:hypothetical protein